MKKRSHGYGLVLLLVAGLTSEVLGQSSWEMGIRLIPQSPKFMNAPSSGEYILHDPIINRRGFRIRPAVGIGATYYLAEHWTVSGDLLYSPQGGGYPRRKTNTNYLKMPLWLGYSAHRQRNLIFTTQLGIEYGYLLKATLADDFSDRREDVSAYLRRGYTGVAWAIGLKKYLFDHTYAIGVQLYLSSGLTNINRQGSLAVRHLLVPGLRITFDTTTLFN